MKEIQVPLLGHLGPRALRVRITGLTWWGGGSVLPHTPPGNGAFGVDAGALGPIGAEQAA